jgi:hypothetical protein
VPIGQDSGWGPCEDSQSCGRQFMSVVESRDRRTDLQAGKIMELSNRFLKGKSFLPNPTNKSAECL